MRRPILSLLLLSLTLLSIACEKNVREVHRDRLDVATPGDEAQTASSAAPAAPSGAPVAFRGKPQAPASR